MGTVFMSNNCILDYSVGNSSFLNYIHQKELQSRKFFKFSPKPIPKIKNSISHNLIFSFEKQNFQKKNPKHHKSQTLTITTHGKISEKIIKPSITLFNPDLKLHDLSIEKKLGSQKSNVMLVRDYKNQFYAMKILIHHNKDLLLNYSEVLRMIIPTPFMTSINNVFFHEDNLYLIIEYMNKGELTKLLTHHLNEVTVKSLLCELILALQHFYSQMKGFYKLLSPENIFLDNENHIKIGNFGIFTPFNPFCISTPVSPFCRTGSCAHNLDFEENENIGPINNRKSSEFSFGKEQNIDRLFYIPPEIFEGNEIIDEKSESWVIGVWLYEILTARMLIKIKTFQDFQDFLNKDIEISIILKGVSIECEDLLKKLIRKKKEDRLSLQEIKKHEFLKDVNWEIIRRREGMGPIINNKKGHHRSELLGKKE